MSMTINEKSKMKHLIVCCIIIIVTVTALVVNSLMLRDTYNGPITKIEAPSTLKMFIPITYSDTTWVKVNKGDSLSVLGLQGSLEKSRHALWVQNNKGFRGFIAVEDLGYEIKAEHPRTKKMEPITILGFDNGFSRYSCKFADGTKAKIDHAKVYPQMPDEFKSHSIYIEGPKVTMSAEKFKSIINGKTLKEIEEVTYPAEMTIHRNDSTIAFFNFTDVIDFDGTKSHTHPIVRFNSDGVATTCTFKVTNPDTDKYIIRDLSFVRHIIDTSIMQNTIKSPLWTPTFVVLDGPPTVWHKALVFVYAIIFGLIWLWITPLLPIAIIGALMHKAVVFRIVDNLPLKIIMILATVIASFIWYVGILMWGYMLLCLVINVVIAYFIYKYIASPLHNFIPHDRCLSCRNLFSMEFIDEVYDHEYQEWKTKSEFAKTLKKERYKYKTWTEVTTTYSNGAKYKHNENYQTHHGTTTTDLYNDYEVLYNVTVNKQIFKCKHCNKEEYAYTYQWQEIDRRHVGQHTSSYSCED